MQQSVCNGRILNPQCLRSGNGCQGIVYIMFTWYTKGNGSGCLTLLHQGKGRTREGVICNICRAVITFRAVSEGNYPARQAAADLLIIFNIPVDDEKSFFIQLLRKETERMADIIQVLEEIQMISFYI